MENRVEILNEIIRLLQRNYTGMLEIQRITKELGDSLARSDRESVNILLKMREEELEKVGENKRGIQEILSVLDTENQAEVKSLLNRTKSGTAEDFESKKIMELSEKIQNILNQIIMIDKALSYKLAGKDSYYKSDR